MSLLIIGLAMLWGAWAWKMWGTTALYDARDDLFKLRDELRTFFILNGYGLAHEQYHRHRDLLNTHIRFIEALSLSTFIAESIAFRSNPKAFEKLGLEVDAYFRCEDAKIRAFSSYVRKTSSLILINYMVERSALAMAAVFFAVPVALVIKASRNVSKLAQVRMPSWRSAFSVCAKALTVSALACVVPARAAAPNPTLSAMEEFSYSSALR